MALAVVFAFSIILCPAVLTTTVFLKSFFVTRYLGAMAVVIILLWATFSAWQFQHKSIAKEICNHLDGVPWKAKDRLAATDKTDDDGIPWKDDH